MDAFQDLETFAERRLKVRISEGRLLALRVRACTCRHPTMSTSPPPDGVRGGEQGEVPWQATRPASRPTTCTSRVGVCLRAARREVVRRRPRSCTAARPPVVPLAPSRVAACLDRPSSYCSSRSHVGAACGYCIDVRRRYPRRDWHRYCSRYWRCSPRRWYRRPRQQPMRSIRDRRR